MLAAAVCFTPFTSQDVLPNRQAGFAAIWLQAAPPVCDRCSLIMKRPFLSGNWTFLNAPAAWGRSHFFKKVRTRQKIAIAPPLATGAD
ncbi:hypothetical protein BK140_12090 [Paenibacillus macerans]|nr:hypothetical protein BK140_12090 [Paenibacillus macerans]